MEEKGKRRGGEEGGGGTVVVVEKGRIEKMEREKEKGER